MKTSTLKIFIDVLYLRDNGIYVIVNKVSSEIRPLLLFERENPAIQFFNYGCETIVISNNKDESKTVSQRRSCFIMGSDQENDEARRITAALLVPQNLIQGTLEFEKQRKRRRLGDDGKEPYREIDMHRTTYLKFQLGFYDRYAHKYMH